MKRWTSAPVALGAVLALAAGPSLAQDRFPDVPPTHWAHDAVEDLANAGLVLGYPDGRFLGDRTLTRYEMASLIKRVVDNLAPRPTPPATGVTPPAPAAGATPEQLAQIGKLVEEFKTELAVIGTDLAAFRMRLEEMDRRVTDVQQDLKDVREVNRSQQAAIDLINRKRIDGYIQARHVSRATNDPALAPENSGTDTSRGLGGNRDTFNVRRARINIRGDVTERAAYRVQLDAGSGSGSSSAVAIKDAYVVVKNFPLQPPAAPGARMFLTTETWLGQSVTPFGHYLPFSSAERLSPERYIAFSDTSSGLFPSQDRDKGLAFRGRFLNRYAYHVGLYNGNGTASNDLGRRKDFIGRISIPLARNWNLGISGYDGEGDNTGTPTLADVVGGITYPGGVISTDATLGGPAQVLNNRRRVKSLIGVDTQYRLPFGMLKLEYVRGKGGLRGRSAGTVPAPLRPYVDAATVEGGYVELGYNVGTRLVLASAYEFFNRNADPAATGPFSVFNGIPVRKGNFLEERAHFGAHYFLDAATRFRLWYELPLNYPNPPGGGEAIRRTGFYTGEIQVRF